MLQGSWYLHLHPAQELWGPPCPQVWWPSSFRSSVQRMSLQESLGVFSGARGGEPAWTVWRPVFSGCFLPPSAGVWSILAPLLFPVTLLAGSLLLRSSERRSSGVSHHPHSHTHTHSTVLIIYCCFICFDLVWLRWKVVFWVWFWVWSGRKARTGHICGEFSSTWSLFSGWWNGWFEILLRSFQISGQGSSILLWWPQAAVSISWRSLPLQQSEAQTINVRGLNSTSLLPHPEEPCSDSPLLWFQLF